MAVLTSTDNLCFEQKYEKYQNFYLKTFSFLVVKFSIYLNRRVFVMSNTLLLRLLLHGPYQAIICIPTCANCTDSDLSHAFAKSHPGICSSLMH